MLPVTSPRVFTAGAGFTSSLDLGACLFSCISLAVLSSAVLLTSTLVLLVSSSLTLLFGVNDFKSSFLFVKVMSLAAVEVMGAVAMIFPR